MHNKKINSEKVCRDINMMTFIEVEIRKKHDKCIDIICNGGTQRECQDANLEVKILKELYNALSDEFFEGVYEPL